MSPKIALLTGASGLVGQELLSLLLKKTIYTKIIVVTRRSLKVADPRVEEIILSDFSKLDDFSGQLEAHDYYCCLGTTIKNAGSKKNFMLVDLDYPLLLAKVAKKSSLFRDFLIVTAAGSNADSPLFYNRVKGELEDKLMAMSLPALKIFRPSLLLGHRREFRLGEEIAKAFAAFFSFFMVGLKRQLWSIRASDVAQAMIVAAGDGKSGIQVYSSSDMMSLSKSYVV